MTWTNERSGPNRWAWVEEGQSEPTPGKRCLDPQDGTLIETSQGEYGVAVCRYVGAEISDGLISTTVPEAWVVQKSGWQGSTDAEVWDLMEQVSDADHPFWADAERQGSAPQDPEAPPQGPGEPPVVIGPPADEEPPGEARRGRRNAPTEA